MVTAAAFPFLLTIQYDLLHIIFHIRKSIFACLLSVHDTISLSRHEQV